MLPLANIVIMPIFSSKYGEALALKHKINAGFGDYFWIMTSIQSEKLLSVVLSDGKISILFDAIPAPTRKFLSSIARCNAMRFASLLLVFSAVE